METVIAFAKGTTGAIVGGVLFWIGICTFLVVKLAITPRLSGQSGEKAKHLKVVNLVGWFDLLAFGGTGAVLLYLHFLA